MNKSQQQIIKQISNIRYTDIQIGKDFQVWLKTCEYIYTKLETIEEKDQKSYLLAAHKILFEAVKKAEDIGYKRITGIEGKSEEFAHVLLPGFLEHICKEVCDSLLQFYKFLILRKLFEQENFCILIISFYVYGTKIGGKSKRGWGTEEILSIVNFMMRHIDLMEAYAYDVIYLGSDGKLLIKDVRNLDNLGYNIHASYSMEKVEKMNKEVELAEENRIKIQQFENDIKKGIEEFIDETKDDDYTKLPPKTIDGNQCEDMCEFKVWENKWDEKPVCACNVRKQGWFGSYLETEKCNLKEC